MMKIITKRPTTRLIYFLFSGFSLLMIAYVSNLQPINDQTMGNKTDLHEQRDCQPEDAEIRYPEGETYFSPSGRLEQIGRGRIVAVEWFPDGTFLVLGTDRGVHILNAQTLEEHYVIKTNRAVSNLKISADGQHIAAKYCSSLVIWDIKTGKLIAHLSDHASEFKFDDQQERMFVQVTHDRTDPEFGIDLEVWDIASQSLVKQYEIDGWLQGVFELSLAEKTSTYGKIYQQYVSWNEQVSFVDLDTNETLQIWPNTQSMTHIPNDVEWTLRKKVDGRIDLVNIVSGEESYVRTIDKDATVQLISPDGLRFLTDLRVDRNIQLDVWDIPSGDHLMSIPDISDVENVGYAFDPTGTKLVTVSPRRIQIWDIATAEIIESDTFSFDSNGLLVPVFSPGGKEFAVITFDGVELYNLETGEQSQFFHSVVNRNRNPRFLSFSPYGDHLMLASYIQPMYSDAYTQLQVWDTGTGQIIQDIVFRNEKILDEGEPLITYKSVKHDDKASKVSGDDYVWAWQDPISNELTWITTRCYSRPDAQYPPCYHALVDKDGSRFVFANYPVTDEVIFSGTEIQPVDNHSLYVIDIESQQTITNTTLFNNRYGFSLSSNGQFLVSGQYGLGSYQIAVIDAQTGELIQALQGIDPTNPVSWYTNFFFTFSHDQTRMAVRQFEQERVRVYDTSTWEIVAEFRPSGHSGTIGLNQDGSIAVLLTNGAVQIWYLED